MADAVARLIITVIAMRHSSAFDTIKQQKKLS